MKLLSESRRRYTFELPGELKNYEDQDGIKIDVANSVVEFLRPDPDNKGQKIFETEEACDAWFAEQLKSGDVADVSEEIIYKAVGAINRTTAKKSITAKDWDLIERYLPENSGKGKDDFVVYDDWFAHNFRDRDNERFAHKILKRFVKTIPGKQKLYNKTGRGHDWFSAGIGKFFKAKLVKLTVAEMMDLVPNHPNPKFKEHLEEIKGIDGALYFAVGSFFIPKSLSDVIDFIDSGIPNSSMGFTGALRKTFTDDKDNFKWIEFELTDRLEAVEVSFVGVESQTGSSIKSHGNKKKEIPDGEETPVKIAPVEDPPDDKSTLQTENENESKTGATMKVSLKKHGIVREIELNEDAVKALHKDVEDAHQEIITKMETEHETAITAVTEELASVRAIVKVFGEELDPAKAAELAKSISDGASYKTMLIDKVIKFLGLLELLDNTNTVAVENEKKFLGHLTVEELIIKVTPLEAKYNESQKNAQTNENGDPIKTDDTGDVKESGAKTMNKDTADPRRAENTAVTY